MNTTWTILSLQNACYGLSTWIGAGPAAWFFAGAGVALTAVLIIRAIRFAVREYRRDRRYWERKARRNVKP